MGLKERVETITGVDNIFNFLRNRKHVQARAIYACYNVKVLKESVNKTSKDMGYVSHASVLHLLKEYNNIKKLPEWQMLIDKAEPKHVSAYLTETKIKSLEQDVKRLKKYTALLLEAEDLGILDEIKEKIELIIKVEKQLKR